MEFAGIAPGRLTVEGPDYFGDWAITPGNVGYTDLEAADVIRGVLEEASGWEQAGVTFRESLTPEVTFQFVHGPFLCGGVMANGCASGGTVKLSYERAQEGFLYNITNHEAGHAFFTGTHEGTPGIMTGDSPDGRPTDSDIADVAEWLGLTPVDPPTHEGVGGAYFFPGGLDTYMTLWDVPTGSEARLNITVLEGISGASLKAVWGRSREDLIEGRFRAFTPTVATATGGLYVSEWAACEESGELCVGIVARRADPSIDLDSLVIGQAEVQIRTQGA